MTTFLIMYLGGKENDKMKLMEPLELCHALQCQNGSLERVFSHEKKLLDRLSGKMTTQWSLLVGFIISWVRSS